MNNESDHWVNFVLDMAGHEFKPWALIRKSSNYECYSIAILLKKYIILAI
jgi:hypothetical protein